jgi:uncharacterized protein YPO0396
MTKWMTIMMNLINEQVGFRLERLEMYNWGTFDKEIWAMSPNSQTAVLTGANGSGKSTVVDALLTLLIEGRQRNYNLASGAGSSRERNERTYVRGQYSRSRGDSAVDARANTLRGTETHTVLLAVFSDTTTEKVVTLAQVLWISNADRVEKRYYVATCDLSIEQHFPQRHIALRDLPSGVQQPKTFSAYIQEVRKQLGLGGKPKALDLFNQTVAVKDIASLNQFVRDHMLDKGDPESKVDGLRAQYRELNEAHASIQRAGQQLAILAPLIKAGQEYRRYDEQIARYDAAKSLVPFYVADKARELLTTAIIQTETHQSAEHSKRSGVDNELTHLRRSYEEVQIAIAQDSVGQMKREIEGKIPSLKGEIQSLRRVASRYDTQASSLGLPVYQHEDDFYENRLQAEHLRQDTNEVIQELTHARDDAQANQRDIKTQAQELDKEIKYLRKNPSNIPERVARIRQEICDALNIPINDLPFIGELLKVRDGNKKWEGVIERLLHSFALELFIPSHHYTAVSQYVNQHNLRGRLVYQRVDLSRKPKRLPQPREQEISGVRVYEKLDIQPDTPYHDWLAVGLIRKFDYICCASMDDLRQAERAITAQGQIKHNATRHEKDDRTRIDNRSNYVLGWNNRAKLQQLEIELDDLTRELDKCADDIKIIDGELDRRRDSIRALKNLLEIEEFAEIDFRSRQAELDHLEARLIELDEEAQQLRQLEQERDRLQGQIGDAEKRRDSINHRITTYENQITGFQRQLKREQQVLQKMTAEDERNWEVVGDVIIVVDRDEMTIETLSGRTQQLEISLQRSIVGFRGHQTTHKSVIENAMHKFRREYPDEGVTLTADIASLAAFEHISIQLETDDLPRYEEQFKRMLDRKATHRIRAFRAQLDERERAIDAGIDELNKSLAQVDYGGGSYIRLLAEPTRDVEVNDFKRNLLACIPDAGDNSQEELERAYNQIKALIERFDTDPNWMLRVIDVRRWRIFSAEQISQEGEQLDYYSDSSGKSGGQKAKLAYTILGSAIAHQYGLRDASAKNKSFRFVVIDEAFSKLDDDNARFAMQLFHQLGLQLLVVTPMQQLHIIEKYVHAYHVVVNDNVGNCSRIFNLTQEQYHQQRQQFQAGD